MPLGQGDFAKMADFSEMTEEQLRYVEKIIKDIRNLGPQALLAQYCNWANLHIQTLNDKGRGAATMRAEQLTPLVFFLRGMTCCQDTEKITVLLKDSVMRALFNAKRYGHDKIEPDDAEEGVQWIMDETRQYRTEL